MLKQNGQIVLILILVMTVALGIGISVIQRSLSDISTSSKVEESSRAFSAAEAGIESAMDCPSCGATTIQLDNQSQANVSGGFLTPPVALNGTRQEPFEFPPLSREQTAHVWLADFNTDTNPPALQYSEPNLDIYWGSSTDKPYTDKAALEVSFVYYDGVTYKAEKWFYDPVVRTPANNFTSTPCTGYTLGSKTYWCYQNINFSSIPGYVEQMMISARLLYNSTSQPVTFHALGTCGWFCSIPPQARTIISIGKAGQTERKVKLFQVTNVAPPYYDYGLFSVGEITK